jgi:hypothetical protein
MRSTVSVALWAALATVFAACTDSPRSVSPTAPVVRPPAPLSSRTVEGRGRPGHSYRVRVDPARKTLELETVNTQAVSSGCSPTQLVCDDGSTGACRPLDPDCGPWYGEVAISGTDSIYVDNGSSGYVAGEEYGPYHCPLYVDNPHFEWRGHHFKIKGRVQKVADLPMTSGIPKGRYLLPPGPWFSDDGEARIWSGTIDGTCFVRDHYFAGIRITEGYVGWYKFTGDGDDGSTTGSGGGGSGGTWVSYGGPGGGGYIDSEAARVLTLYLEEGTCTSGWVIIVDGVRVC